MGGWPLRLFECSWALPLLAALAACGGRSSTLEPDETTPATNQPTGGSTGAASPGAGGAAALGNVGASGPATAGRGGTSAGGTAGVGNAGGAASGGTPSGGTPSGGAPAAGAPPEGGGTAGAAGISAATYTSCINYCGVTTQAPCPSNTSVAECFGSCLSDLGRSPRCEKAGQSWLDCLTAAHQHSVDCRDFDDLASAKCAGLSTAYRGCVSPGEPPPTPSPEPACSSSGSSSNGTCSLNLKCESGAYYTVTCSQTSPNQSSCVCSAVSLDGSSVRGSIGLNESVTFACYDTLAACGFPQVGAK